MHWAGRSLPVVETTKEHRNKTLACRNWSSWGKICEKRSGDHVRRLLENSSINESEYYRIANKNSS